MSSFYRHLALVIPCLPLIAGCTPCRQVRIDSTPPGAVVAVRREMPGVWPRPDFIWDEIGTTPFAVDSCALSPDLRARLDGDELMLYYHKGVEAIFFDFDKGEAREIPGGETE